MKKLKTAIIILLILTILVGLFGCSKNVSHTPVIRDIEDFQEIDCDELSSCLQNLSEEVSSIDEGWQTGGGIENIRFLSEDMRITYDYYNLLYDIDDDAYSSYVNEDGIDTRDITRAYGHFDYEYDVFKEYLESNPDEIIMEIQDTRGYIIFDIDDPEIITAITDRDDVSEDTRYYGCIYFCDRGYLEAYYLSDDDEYLDEFVEFLDGLDLPHL